jgi:hypothetical protein
MRTSEGGLSRAKRDHVALATARRASIADARNPLSPTTFEKPAFKAGFFSSKFYAGELKAISFGFWFHFRRFRVFLPTSFQRQIS